MIAVPQFLLKRLYVKGSLHNNDQGFQFELKNSLGSGYGKELLPLTLDGKELLREESYFTLGDEKVSFSAVSEDHPFTLKMNKIATIMVHGVTLTEGPHKIGFRFVVQGIGKLAFEVTDLVSAG
jgi:hypothetical protein